MNTQEYFWNECKVEGFFLPNRNMVMSLAFYFDEGRALIYKVNKKYWAFAVERKEVTEINENNKVVSYSPLSTKQFPVLLNEITSRKEVEFKSMLNTAGFSNRNAGQIIGQMAGKMIEHLEEISVEMKTFDDAVSFFKPVEKPSWLNIIKNLKVVQYIEDDAPYVISTATLLSIKIEDSNPLFTQYVAPPSSGKSEFLKMLTPDMMPNKYTYPLSDLTSKSMISGLEGNDDLYPKLDGKLVVMEEFTNLITKQQVERAEIMGQIRTMYGGSYSKTFGSGVGTKGYKAHIGFLIGCTPMIDRIAAEMAIAGDKWIKVRASFNNDEPVREKIVDMAYEDKIKDHTLITAIQDEIFSLYEEFNPTSMPEIPDHLMPFIKNCAHITAYLRASVDRDEYRQTVTSEPVIEIPARIMKVYKKLARMIAWMMEKPEVDNEVISYIYRVTLDTPTANRVSILRQLGFVEDEKSYAVLAEDTLLSKNTVKMLIEELMVTDIVKEGAKSIGAKNMEGEDDSKMIETFYLNVDSILFNYIATTELLLDTLPPEQTHHKTMSVKGIDMWKKKTGGELTIDAFDYTSHGAEGDDSEPDHTFVPDPSHLTDHNDPEWNPEPEIEASDEPRIPHEVPADPNEDVEDEHNDPNA